MAVNATNIEVHVEPTVFLSGVVGGSSCVENSNTVIRKSLMLDYIAPPNGPPVQPPKKAAEPSCSNFLCKKAGVEKVVAEEDTVEETTLEETAPRHPSRQGIFPEVKIGVKVALTSFHSSPDKAVNCLFQMLS